jgi:hypothetical protein
VHGVTGEQELGARPGEPFRTEGSRRHRQHPGQPQPIGHAQCPGQPDAGANGRERREQRGEQVVADTGPRGELGSPRVRVTGIEQRQ